MGGIWGTSLFSQRGGGDVAEAGLIGRSTGQEYALKIIDKARCCGKVSWERSPFSEVRYDKDESLRGRLVCEDRSI